MERCLSCADCAVVQCERYGEEDRYPDFCVTRGLREEEKEDSLIVYDAEEERGIMKAAAEVEHEGYCRLTRLEEIMAFARKMEYERIGIATCVGLIAETRALAKVLRANGFSVFGVACKAGSVPKTCVGIGKECEEVGITMCNPVLQAQILGRENTQLNIVMGLCVGHDSLFYKHSEAPVTTLVTKDRVLGHNPCAALYTAGTYYREKLFPADKCAGK